MTLITQAEYARRCGVTRPAVLKWKRRGLVVMNGDLVDFEASNARLDKYRRAGLPEPIQAARKRGEAPVQLQCVDIVADLEDLDWKQTFDWSPAAQVNRVSAAARCVGCIAVQSDLRDDGHWGGFQLRRIEIVEKWGVTEDSIEGGWGFELYAHDALRLLRAQLEPIEDDDFETVVPDLLPLLAHPWSEHDTPKADCAGATDSNRSRA